MSVDGAILSSDSTPNTVPGEKFYFSQDKVSFSYLSGNGYPGSGDCFMSPSGKVYVSNVRVVYVANPSQPNFHSFSAPLHNIRNGKLQQPWLGANFYEAHAYPVPLSNLRKPGVVKFTFQNGGAFEFSTIFKELSARIPEGVNPLEESLPEYQAPPPPPAYSASD
ncbi:uncharacterized protein BJ171DRAFT_577210 [Polychytrium aggregatum]|uniref:uncharacterized protein n=1 Tax=Polychytrium aggregatum TaxID=110093 RepID=UPI0022FDF1E2|nr:uncharacterized protein BJ171DRAFT_577210 [Polychytrium aggregatum]KAI9208863.1 hypothetical protein BJ171DRAFT_577210 [Polychytrium aggregatum]